MDQLIQFDGLPVLSGSAWPGVQYFSTTRLGGVSHGPWSSFNLGLHVGDDDAAVQANRRRLERGLPASPVWLQQMHGVDVCDVDHDVMPSEGLAMSGTEADAVATVEQRRVLAIMTADCLPVVLGSSDGRVVGVAHAGWRGLAAGVLENTLDVLGRKDGRSASAVTWRAWIGPGISQTCFEVGDEVRRAFVRSDVLTAEFFQPGREAHKWQADLPGIAAHRLRRWGVAQVEWCGVCTFARDDLFYSYRRMAVTGRFATLAWRTGKAA